MSPNRGNPDDYISAWPLPVGKTKSSGPLGHASFASFKVFVTNGPIGMVSRPDRDFREPMEL